MDLSASCPVHGMPKTSSPFIVNGKTFDSGSPRFNTLDKKTAGYRDTEPMSSSQMPEVMTTSTAYSPLVLVKETTAPNSADYVLYPKHGNVLASLSSSTNDSSHTETPLSPTVRTTRTIKLHPFTPTSKNSTLKPKHVEFAEEPSSTFGTAVPTTPPTNKSGFSTTV
uniref:Uncharacterized protein n=1 Tax=Mesocestoides corti TaxID=53468 RepID=A0A5K3F0H0_MESCO